MCARDHPTPNLTSPVPVPPRQMGLSNNGEQGVALLEKNNCSDPDPPHLPVPAFWLSWFVTCTLVNLACVLVLCGFGYAIGLDLFVDNEFSV